MNRQYTAEAIGTFCLLFAGTGAIVVNGVSDGAITHVGIALTFGLVVMAMIYAIGDVAGLSEETLMSTFGPSLGKHFHRLACGIDDRPVVPGHERKSVGRETTFAHDLAERSVVSIIPVPPVVYAARGWSRGVRRAR